MIIYANLDQEAKWSGLGIPAHVARRISEAAVLLAALAPRGEEVEIWAPAEVGVRATGVTMRAGTPPRWDLAWADPGAKAVNDRRFALALATELGCALPGARALQSLEGIAWPARWVCKVAWTAAGRDRARGEGEPAGELRARVARLVARGAVLEPWLDRICDFGVCGAVGRPAHPPHALVVDARGTFRGIERGTALEPAELVEVARAYAAVSAALARAGYAGPFGLDGFVYRDESGARALHPFCELNARHTFGHIAHALGCRVLGFGEPPPGATTLVAGEITAWAVS
jgi:hypothetical protein